METTLIAKKFEIMGARVKFRDLSSPVRRVFTGLNQGSRNITVDVLKDKEGEYFDIRSDSYKDVQILDVQKKDRHLLLMARDTEKNTIKFLCGHDERHWFTAAVPETKVSTVLAAKQALKPKELVDIEVKGGVKSKELQKRRRKLKTGGKIIRQGEFMFVPDPNFKVNENGLVSVQKNERLARGGNPHIADYLYRSGGTIRYTAPGYEQGITETEFRKITREPDKRRLRWRQNASEPAQVYVKGHIRHPEHATVSLGSVWHKVILNTEQKARGFSNVTFLD
jgi:hypothetical protein